MDYRLGLMCGIDLPIPALQIIIHQPRLKEIALVGEEDFFIGIQALCLDKNKLQQDERVLSQFNNFQIFMTMMFDKASARTKACVQQVLTLLFPDYNSMMTPSSLILRQEDQIIVIDENNFEDLQNILKEIFCLNREKDDLPTYNPVGNKAKEIAEKIMRGRAIVAKIKGSDKESVFTRYISVLVVGLQSMSLNEVLDLTVFQFYDLMERYRLYTSWDLDIRGRMAGAKAEQPLEDWTRNLYK